MRGEEIPVDVRRHFGSDRFSRLISIYSRELDRTTHFQCPDCEKAIDRATAYRASD